MELTITIKDGDKRKTLKASGDPGELVADAAEFFTGLSKKLVDVLRVDNE